MAKITVHGGPSQWLGEPEPKSEPEVVQKSEPKPDVEPAPAAVEREPAATDVRDNTATKPDVEEPKRLDEPKPDNKKTLPRRGHR